MTPEMTTSQTERTIGTSRYLIERLSGPGSCLLSREQFPQAPGDRSFFFETGDAGCRLHLAGNTLPEGQSASDAEGFGWMGEAELKLSAKFPRPVYLSVILQDVAQIAAEAGISAERPLAIRFRAECSQLEYEALPGGGYGEAEAVSLSEVIGFLFFKPEHIPRDDDSVRALCRLLSNYPAGGGIYALSLVPLQQIEPASPENALALIQPETLVAATEIELYAPHRSCDAGDFLVL